MAKRLALFILTNILVMLTITVTLRVLGVERYITPYGLNYDSLMIFSLVVGFSGAFISLAMSRFMAKMMMGVQVIDPRTTNPAEQRFLNQVHNLCRRAGLKTMPEVGIYPSPEVNAFATGPMKTMSLVAVSSGLLDRMDDQAVEGVLAHEVAHIANGDMVTMTLLQGVINTFVVFLSRVIAFAISNFFRSNDRESRGSVVPNFILVFVLEILLSLLGSLLVARYSRWREFHADAGGARLAGRDNMIHALKSLGRTLNLVDESHQSLSTFKISSKPKGGFFALFMTHPPLEDRIEALEKMKF